MLARFTCDCNEHRPNGSPFLRRALVLARAEVLHVVRDRATLVQIVVLPLIQLLILSNVTTFAIRQLAGVRRRLRPKSVSRGLVSRSSASGLFDIVGQSALRMPADDAMLRGRATFVVTIPRDFEDRSARGNGADHLDVNRRRARPRGLCSRTPHRS